MKGVKGAVAAGALLVATGASAGAAKGLGDRAVQDYVQSHPQPAATQHR